MQEKKTLKFKRIIDKSHFIIKLNPNSIFTKKNYITHIPIDKQLINTIIDSGWDKTYEDSKDWCIRNKIPSNTLSAIGHLKMIFETFKKKKNSILRSELYKNDIGRAYYKKAISLANLPREVRQALQIRTYTDIKGELNFNNLLYDYDIDNAHPNILLNICEKSGVPKKQFKTLKKYCDNREDILKLLQDNIYNSEENARFLCKQFILQTLNGGSINGQLDKLGIKNNTKNEATKFLHKLQNEVFYIFKTYFIPANQQFYNTIVIKKKQEIDKGDKQAPFRSFIARTLQHFECIIMEDVLLKMMSLKLIKKDRFDYAFDGFIVPEKIDILNIKKITKELGWNLSWSIKQPVEGLGLWKEITELTDSNNDEIEHPENSKKIFDDDYFKTLYLNYPKLKDYFELFYTFVKNPEPMFVFRRYKSFINGKTGRVEDQYCCSYLKEQDVRKCYKNIHSRTQVSASGNTKKILFLDDYMEDIDMVKKEEIEFYPQNSNNPISHNKRYLNTFTGYNDIVFEKGITFDKKSLEKGGILYNFMLVVKNLVGGLEERKCFLYLLAYKIKYPARKLPFAILIKGHQGSGKNTILEQMSKIIGEQHYNTTANLKDITGDYAEGMMNKLIVNLNEINFNESKGKADLLKSLISENRMSFNVKYCRPITQNVYALIIATTNNVCSMKLDIISGERRWFIFESNGNNKVLKKINKKHIKSGLNGWDNIHKEWEKKDFVQQLYLYLMDLPIEKFNFQQAQTKMASTKAYNKLASYFIPNSALMIKDFIIGGYNKNSFKNENGQDYIYFEDDKFYQNYECDSRELHNWYESWYRIFKGNDSYKCNAKKFQNNIMGLSLKSIEKIRLSGNKIGFEFKPCDVLKELNENKLINIDMCEWREITNNDNNINDDWDF